MEYIKTAIEGVYIIEPKVFSDARGYFMEAWKQQEFNEHVGHVDFIQDNESKSSFGVLRGLHYQKGALSQSKLVRVIKGKVLDVAVDIRKSSPTFGQHVMVELSEDNKRQFFIATRPSLPIRSIIPTPPRPRLESAGTIPTLPSSGPSISRRFRPVRKT